MVDKLISKLKFEARNFGHVRFEEPIVIFESDDWGKVNSNESAIFDSTYGKRTDWSYDQLENETDLEQLFNKLYSYRNDFERPPVFTANFIVSNPNFEATLETGFEELILEPIDSAFPNLIRSWNKGKTQGVFYPQYHGRLHYNYKLYKASLKNDKVVQALFKQKVNGGLEHFEHSQLAYYSEYQNYTSQKSSPLLQDWIKEGLKEFDRIFGYQSKSTIAPNYVLATKDIGLFAGTEVRFLQGSNKLLSNSGLTEKCENYCQGASLAHNLTALSRNHKFEPCRNKKEWKVDFSIFAAKTWLNRNVPVVFDTHRMNYVSNFADSSLNELGILIDSFRDVKNIKFLTSVELGEAICNKGVYKDVFTGETKTLTPMDSFVRKSVRNWVH